MAARPASPRVIDLLENAGLAPLDAETAAKFQSYLSLFVRWNRRLNLSSVRDPESIVERHFAESIVVAHSLPPSIHTLLDFGSGGGLPGIPIALCRPELSVTLAESQGKKAAFLQEAVRVLEINAKVHSDRAEALVGSPVDFSSLGPGRAPAGAPACHFDCVILRAVEKMPRAVASAAKLVAPEGWLALMITDAALTELQTAAGSSFHWDPSIRLPGSDSRILSLGQRAIV